MSNELKPCPFCGSTDIYSMPSFNEWGICCSQGCVRIYGDFQEDAVKAWNTRPAPPDNQAVLESVDLKEYIRDEGDLIPTTKRERHFANWGSNRLIEVLNKNHKGKARYKC